MKLAFAPIADYHSHTLILGTMPGEKSFQLNEYYGNKGNQFWKLLFAAFNEPFSDDYDKKMQLLKRHGIALWDVLKSCERLGSLDSNIKNEEANDFVAFYKKHPCIKRVFFSSKNAWKFYKKHVGFTVGYEYLVLPSPSGAHASMRFEEKLIWWCKIVNNVDENKM